ncbi:NAD(P)-dependent glycerol-3-phosphate dehydrogenase [Methylophaga sp. SB9B]|uniref:NAD(P)H-dependent glycerol-3-phosphate dehydrogenase n=1 Tax=Methylophaga sp. SB9B TaxID=2570356 RepID=UPI0010A8CF73|nr:NAD(P)H-dependent glycerol-3-phosphate dehydrogenase [Methylophaga sp. SB9B]THK41554.1 NAD(P)-dependent glycerol-3-phosphate dehydrogenase [Methylophaga sp. SB9B]
MNASTLMPTLVIGAGAWGTALAIAMARNGHEVWLWGRDKEQLSRIATERMNSRYLPEITLPESLKIEMDLAKALTHCQHVMVSVPSAAFSETLNKIKPFLPKNIPLSWATKGLTPQTGQFLHDTAIEILGVGHSLAVVSGPSFAAEVAAGLPTALTVASRDSEFAKALANALHGPALRAYTTNDLLGVQIGGTVKNVLAIAAGICDGLGYGANARAALLTRGMAEIMRLASVLGAEPETMFGLSGMGDLILTCTDNQSRNRQLGLAIGSGLTVDEAVVKVGKTVEGMHAAREVLLRAQQAGIEMPIVEQVCKILFEGYDPRKSVQALLCREQKAESPVVG